MTAVATPLTPTVGQTARRLRFPLLIAALVVVLVVVPAVFVLNAGAAREFAVDGRGPNGAGALSAVLEQQGVTVDAVTTLADARQAGAATLLVDDQDHLLDDGELAGLAQGAASIVVIDPGGAALAALAGGVDAAGQPLGGTASAGCVLPAALRGGVLSLTDATQSFRADVGTLCFADSSGAGQVWQGALGSTAVTLIASPQPFENRHIAERGDAAVALGLLGARDRLVWYTPDVRDLPASGPATLQQLTPPWVTPFMVLLLTAGLAAAFWRGRRLGPLVVERLPVVVRTRETVEGRARLYERGRARLRAADALRIGTVSRIAPFLGLGRAAAVGDVVVAAAVRTGRPVADLRALLVDAEPASDSALVALSDDLAALERAVLPNDTRSGPARGTGTIR